MARNKISPIPPKKTFWVACEGKGEMAFVAWLNQLAKENRKPVHLESADMGGGSQKSMLEKANRKLAEARKRAKFVHAFLLIDNDRPDNPSLETFRQDAKSAGFTLILQEPNFEGVLCRLHSKYKQQQLDSQRVGSLIQELWSGYDKARLNAFQLREKFGYGLDVLQLLAERDEELRNFLIMTKLVTV
ncbi:MAG: RloB domain-containing protein [Alphaproteobacteria bacterium]|nr:RloB domain-containing protein [Alphaproteobacteria bacterium]